MLRAITKVAESAADLAAMAGRINGFLERGVAIQMGNDTDLIMDIATSQHQSGGFFEPPDPRVDAKSNTTFGSKGTGGAKGSVTYTAAGASFSYTIHWEVPVAGANTASTDRSGGLADYYDSPVLIGIGPSAIAKFHLFAVAVEPNFKQCSKCASLVLDGSAAPCAGGGTHDLSASRLYKVLVDPPGTRAEGDWKLCSVCRCLNRVTSAFAIITGLCHAGGTHNVAGSHDYRLVTAAAAPGDPAKRCLPCQGAVFNLAKACPASLPIAVSTAHVIDPTSSTYRVL